MRNLLLFGCLAATILAIGCSSNHSNRITDPPPDVSILGPQYVSTVGLPSFTGTVSSLDTLSGSFTLVLPGHKKSQTLAVRFSKETQAFAQVRNTTFSTRLSSLKNGQKVTVTGLLIDTNAPSEIMVRAISITIKRSKEVFVSID